MTIPIFHIFLALPFRSSTNEGVESIDFQPAKNYYRSDANEGKFIGLVKLMAGENSTLAQHLINCQKTANIGRRNPITLLSKRFINRALLNVREYLVRAIVEEINRNGGCFGLLMDGSQDVSSKEQISVVVRYVNDEHIVVERTVAFFNAKDTSGQALYDRLKSIISGIGLSLSNVNACCFDGASNMRGEFSGLRARLKDSNANCLYVWCLSHQFSLAMNAAVDTSKTAKSLFHLVEESAKMFRGSHVKMGIWDDVTGSLRGTTSKIKLKLIGTTRWSSKPNALQTIISTEERFVVLIKSLIRVCSLKTLDGKKLEQACKNLNSWVDYRNIVSAHVMRRIFSQIDSTCICLQKLGLSFFEGVQSLKKCCEKLEEMKEEIKIYFDEADEFVRRTIKLLNNDAEIQAHHMNIIRLPEEQEVANMIDDLQTEFCDFVSTLKNRITEHILIHFDEKDSLYYEIQALDPLHCSKSMSGNESMQFDQLCAINNVDQSVVMQELREIIPDFLRRRNPSQYVSVLSDNDDENFENSDDDDDEITVLIENESDFDEASADVRFQRVKFETMSELCHCSSCIVKYIGADAERSKKYANVLKLYKYIAMIPPTQVKCERDFSKMKLVKTRLRANLRDDSMESLMLISTESNMFNGIEFDDIVDYIIEKSSKLSLFMNT